ncbi:MAG TPA: hypothetical protein VM324_07975 [Egibacteraceae bacterium]|nr:hypothetical protein [Egibacteraceae bacterium]
METCEACGSEVAAAEAVRVEMAVEDLMCPTPMSFHRECYESADQVWGPPTGESLCAVDPEFPDETRRWLEISGATTRTDEP